MNPATDVKDVAKKAGKRTAIFSIGVFSGPDVFSLSPDGDASMPVLTARDVTDIQAQFVADPFMVHAEGGWNMFFEVMNVATGKGDIGLATSSDGLRWKYRQIVLTEPFHLSYPYVFSVDGEYYMLPESYAAEAVRLYRADPFPTRWTLVREIMKGARVDSSIFFHQGRWWIFSSPVAPEHQVLELFHAENILGPWRRHDMNPIVQNNKHIARSAGRVIVAEDRILRFAQDCLPYYGTSVRAFEISGLTPSRYTERETEKSPVLAAGRESWRVGGMHHIDAHSVGERWIACVDGWRFEPPELTVSSPQT